MLQNQLQHRNYGKSASIPAMPNQPPANANLPRNVWVTCVRWVLTLLVFAIVLWFAGDTLQQAWRQLAIADVHISWQWCLAAGLLYLVGLAPMVLYWAAALASLDQRPSWVELFRGYYLGHLGKYAPGKALVVVLRTGALARAGCDARATVVSVFLETLTFMSTGAALAAILLATSDEEAAWLAAGLALIAGLPILPPIARRLAQRVVKKQIASGHTLDNLRQLAGINWKLSITGVLAATTSWCLLGLSLWATLRAVGVDSAMPIAQLALWVKSVALPMVAGFLSLVPGGLVVRDSLVTELLTPAISPQTALIAAALWRVVSLVSEAAICVIIEVSRLGFASPPSTPPIRDDTP